MAGSQIATSVTIISSLLGYQAISLTNFTTSAVSLIAAGSKVEVGSAFFNFPGNETPNASSWTAVGTGNVAYLTVIPAGSAGNQTITAEWTETEPAWSTSKQAWYASAASLTRYVAMCLYKGGETAQEYMHIMIPSQGAVGSVVVPVGEWDMDTTQYIDIHFGISGFGTGLSLYRGAECIVYDDADQVSRELSLPQTINGQVELGGGVMLANDLRVGRQDSSTFDGVAYNGTVSTIANRADVTIYFEYTS